MYQYSLGKSYQQTWVSIFPCGKAKAIGLTEVDRKLLRMQKKAQEVIITAAIRSNYPIVKILHSDGYKVI